MAMRDEAEVKTVSIDMAWLKREAKEAMRLYFAPLNRAVCFLFGHRFDRVLFYSERRMVSVFGCDRCLAAHFRLYCSCDDVSTDVLKTPEDVERWFEDIRDRS